MGFETCLEYNHLGGEARGLPQVPGEPGVHTQTTSQNTKYPESSLSKFLFCVLVTAEPVKVPAIFLLCTYTQNKIK